MNIDLIIDHMPKEIQRYTGHRTFLPGESIVRKGDRADHVYVVLKGSARVSNEFASGQRYTFGTIEIGDLIGDLEVLAGQKFYSATNEAVTVCEIITMTSDTFLRWMRLDNEFSLNVAQQLAAKMYPTSNEAGRVKFLPSLERLHSYLLKHLGATDTNLFILHTSRQQIADDIGTSVKTVNRGITKLRDEGLIGLLHGKITITREQHQALEQLYIQEKENS